VNKVIEERDELADILGKMEYQIIEEATGVKRRPRKIPEEQSIYAYGNSPAAVNLFDILQKAPKSVRSHMTRIMTRYSTILNKLTIGDSTERYVAKTMLLDSIDEVERHPDLEYMAGTHTCNVLKTRHKEWLRGYNVGKQRTMSPHGRSLL